MKKVFLFVVLACAAIVNAQDVIVTTDGQRINAKITEVSKKEIKYYESDFLDGPLFILETSDVDSILFRNGKAISCRQRRDRERPRPTGQGTSYFGANNGNHSGHHGDGFFGQGNGQRGNTPVVGRGTSGGHDWSLAERSLVGNLPAPSNDYKQQGTIVVEIRVNASGDVINAEVKGGTISDKATQRHAVKAAYKAKFSTGKSETTGTITYNFK